MNPIRKALLKFCTTKNLFNYKDPFQIERESLHFSKHTEKHFIFNLNACAVHCIF